MDAAPFPPSAGTDLTDPAFAELLLGDEDRGRRCDLLSDALLNHLIRCGTLDSSADVDTPAVLESLVAVELNVVLDARLGVELGLATLRHPASPRELAGNIVDLLEGATAPAGGTALIPDVDGRFEAFVLTDLQQAYLLGRGGFFALGNVPAAFYAEIDAVSADLERLEAAWNVVVARHDMLRTVFTDDGRQQALADVPDYCLTRHDLRDAAPEEREACLAATRELLAGRVRDADQWPLFDIAATLLDDGRIRIHVAIDLLIADAPSIRQVMGEWLAVSAGRDPGLAPQVSFRDYVRALEGVEETPAYQKGREYWLGRLPELPAAPELPLRTAPESVEAARFSSRSLQLDPERWRRLRQHALRGGLTPSMALCWAYAATLRAWSASDAFTLNVTVNDRLPLHPDIDRVIGEFTSQVLVAVETDGQSAVRDRIGALQDRFWADFEHRAFSGVRVLRELARSDDGTRTTMPFVFDAVLGQDLYEAELPDWFQGLSYVAATAPQVALECQVFELGGVLRVNWAVVEELFPPGLIDAAFAAFGRVLERLADEESFWDACDLGLVGAGELAAREEANATHAGVPEGLLHELGGSLRARGEAPAVIAPDRTLNYEEVDRRAARIARRLQELSVCPNTLVGVVMEKGWEQPVAALGILQSGAAYLPIDATWPTDRIHHVLKRGQCRVVLTQSHVAEQTSWPADVTVLAVDEDAVWAGMDDAPVELVAGPEDLAYVIFTSGSTGEPKGVMIDHRGATNTVVDINSRFDVSAADRVLGLSSLSFDLSVWDIFGMFAAGGTLVLPPTDAHRDPQAWLELVRSHHVTVWNTVPALMEMLAEHAAARGEGLEVLRLVLMSGDWIPLSLPGRIHAVAPEAELISLGGATEASIWSIHHPIGELDPDWPSIPYGRPLANQTFAVLDNDLQPVPTWVPGELYIGGIGVARGYWADPDKTAERFITHPVTGDRLYRTGDLGRYHPDGTIEFLGRNDHQIKINGYRIELGEIEAKLSVHPAVKEAVVTAMNNRLTAYLTPAPREMDDESDRTRVTEWERVFNTMRSEVGVVGDDFDTTGWNSTYTGAPIAEEAMRWWVDETVRRILECAPSHVLELGCGTGLLATRIAPHADYTGVDVSAETLATLQAYLDTHSEYAERVRLLHGDARDVADIEDGSVDCVVINSVVQYFPSGAYLLDVLREAARVLADCGTLFVGDVRDLRLLGAFHTSVELFQAAATDTAGALAERVARRALQERELAISPDLFRGLRGLGFTMVSLRPKTGDPTTEMADYRYDVILRKAADPAPADRPGHVDVLDGRSATVFDELHAILGKDASTHSTAVLLRGLRNPRLASDLRAAQLLDTGAPLARQEVVDRSTVEGFRTDDLSRIAADAGWWIEARLTEVPDEVDVVFHRDDPTAYLTEECSATDVRDRVDELVNRPAAPELRTRLVERVRQHLVDALPGYMLPDHYMVLDRLPLSANGKVDRSRLPAPDDVVSDHSEHSSQPRNLREERLAAVWCDILGRQDVGIDADFFNAGGDSLLAVRVAAAASVNGLPLTAADIFAHPTIAAQAELLANREHAAGDAHLPGLVPDPNGRFEAFVLTDLQQAYLLGRGGFFALGNVPAAFYAEIDALSVDVERLEAAWNVVVARHDMLRTVFTDDGRQQALAEVPAYRFARHDLRDAAPEECEASLAGTRDLLAGRVRNADQWPLFDIAVTLFDDDRARIHVAIDLLIADGATLGGIVHEWGAYYREPTADLPLPAVSFRDYVQAVEGVEETPAYQKAREYWLGRLPELPAAPELPLRTAPESVEAARFSSRSLELDPERWRRLRQHALRSGLTPSMALCWAYAATLRAWSASDAFTLNVTVNDRLPLHPDIDRIIGEFTSVMLLATELDTTTSVRDQARALQDRFWADFEQRAFSGVRVLRELVRTDTEARATMPVVFTSALGDGEASLGRAAEEFGTLSYAITQTPQVYLDCQVFELGGALRVNWAVVEELFPPGLIDAAFAAFGRVLERLADEESFWDACDLGLVGAGELAAREEANATQAAVPEGLLHELGGSLRARGEAPAVIAPGRTLSYEEVDRRAARIARRLQELSVCPNTLVGVVMEKGWEQPVAALGILQSGAAYLPIDAAWPTERVHHILDRGQCRVALTQSRLIDQLTWPDDVTVLAVDEDAMWTSVDDAPVESVAGPEDLAYVIFTSGSTGEPKGVMIDHRGAANTVVDINSRFGVSATDRVLGLSSLSFDLSVWDIFGMFAAGGTLVLPPTDANRDPDAWTQLLHRHEVTIWNTVPALMEMLAEHAAARGEGLEVLRLVLMSGDWIPLSLPGRIHAVAPQAELISLGGATEASIWSIHHPIGELDPEWPSIPYGRPLANQTFAVLDSDLQPVPTWVPGELYIGGIGVARGYWADPEKTAERFITHPVTGERLYRTGDLGRYHPDGTIEFLGRNDHQVKINGYRIELGEIEAKLSAHPAVKDAIVTASDNQLTAYLIPISETAAADPDPLISDVRRALAASLPDYMVPRNFVPLDALPLSANGKVDRSALPVPMRTAGTPSGGFRAADDSPGGSEPRNDIERRLRDIWTDVLGVKSVGIHDVFGDLGGDSLLALRVISRAADAGLAITPRQFFEHPTIAGLACVATLAAPRTEAETQVALAGEAPLLPAQAMLLKGTDAAVARHHNYALFLELDEPMERVALRVALRTVVTRHDALRTGFVHGSQGWRQRVMAADEPMTAPLEWVDLLQLPADEQDRTIEEYAERAQRSFDLAAPPLLRVLYFDRGRDRRPELLLLAHWLVVDNFSLRLLLEELLTAHAQIAEEGQAHLPPPSVPTSVWARQVEHYAKTLTATSPQELAEPQTAPSPRGLARDAVTLIKVLDASAVIRLREHAAGAATVGDVLLATLARSARTAGRGESIRVDVDGHGRAAALPGVTGAAADLSRTVGRLSVRYPLDVPTGSDTDATVRTVVAARSASSNGGLDHAVLNYGSDAGDAGGKVSSAEFAFNYLGAVDELYGVPGLRPSTHRPGPLVHPDTPLRHRFEMLCGTVDGELLVGLTCASPDRSVAERLLDSFLAELGGAGGAAPESMAVGGQGSRGSVLAETFRYWLSPGTAT
jgi:amino acid adenylation domain-containing protein